MRLFVGVDLPGEVKDELAGLITTLRSKASDEKWIPRDNLHLTVSFLGEVNEERVPAIVEALTGARANERGPIPTALGGTGAFPSPRRARVLWVSLDDPAGRLAALANRVQDSLEPAGFPKEKRAWTPHLTLARFRTPGDASALKTARPEPRAFEVEEITLFRSRLGRPAPAYEPLDRIRLDR